MFRESYPFRRNLLLLAHTARKYFDNKHFARVKSFTELVTC